MKQDSETVGIKNYSTMLHLNAPFYSLMVQLGTLVFLLLISIDFSDDKNNGLKKNWYHRS